MNRLIITTKLVKSIISLRGIEDLLDVKGSEDINTARLGLEMALDGNIDHSNVEDIRKYVQASKACVMVTRERLAEHYKPEYIAFAIQALEWVTEQLIHVVIELDSPNGRL